VNCYWSSPHHHSCFRPHGTHDHIVLLHDSEFWDSGIRPSPLFVVLTPTSISFSTTTPLLRLPLGRFPFVFIYITSFGFPLLSFLKHAYAISFCYILVHFPNVFTYFISLHVISSATL
jgi:hypothetical protein